MNNDSVNKEDGYLRIKAFDVNSRKNNPTEVATLNPADSYLITYYSLNETIHILLDTGKPQHGENVIIPYLLEQGIHKLDYVILSHMHLDHFGGMIDILKDDRITVDQFIYSPLPEEVIKHSSELDYSTWMEVKQLLKQDKLNITEINHSRMGQKININEELFFGIVATPNLNMIPEDQIVDLNEFNLVLKLNFRDFTALFPGDCGEMQANQILNSPQKEMIRSVSLLKASHHGGDYSTTSTFIEICDPKIVLIPCNEVVVEHRPSFIQNLHEFSRNGAKIFRADRCHDFTLETDGKYVTCQMETETYSERVRLSQL